MNQDDIVLIWNRAARPDNDDNLRTGDRALAALLAAHGATMNGGVFNAIDTLDRAKLEEAISGYHFFGLGEVGDLFLKATDILRDEDTLEDAERDSYYAEIESWEPKLDAEYARIVPDDAYLIAAFKRHLLANPEDFAV